MANHSTRKKSHSKQRPEPAVATMAADVTAVSVWRRLLHLSVGAMATGLILVLLAVIAYFGYEYIYQDKVYPGVSLAGQNLGGMNYEQAAALLQDYKADLDQDGLTFTYQADVLSLPLKNETESAAVPLVEVLSDDTLHKVFAVGRTANASENIQAKVAALLYGETVPVATTVQTETLQQLLAAEFDQYSTDYTNASFDYSETGLDVTKHSDGRSFHWADVLAQVDQKVHQLKPITITLTLQPDPAPVTTAAATAAEPAAQTILDLAPLTLTYEDQTFTIDQAELATWLELTPADTAGSAATVTLSDDALKESLIPITGDIDVPVQEGRFSLDIVNDEVKLKQFQDGQDGLAVQTDKTAAAIKQALLEDRVSAVPLVVEVTHPRATPDNISDLGIKELLGTGETSFSGSPTNRIGNIRKGADLLNGLLIAPGETFSLLDILKPFDIEHGWLPELVIKGNKLEKEPGGGLCQIGSTSFRAAMMSGQEIVERRNHSWAVSYYNYNGKAGVDATIYDPAPDFKFKNTTDHYILWRSRIEGSNIYFEFWGTSDGRKGSFTEPVNYGYVAPGPTEETLDASLPPGTRNCAQHPYTGVTASFDYTIDWPDGHQDKENFTSTYKAQPQRCLVGPTAEPAEDTSDDTTTGDSTNTNSNTNSTNTNQSNSNTANNNSKNKN